VSSARLVEARDLKRVFDVSQPWLSRLIDREPRRLLRAVDGVDFAVDHRETLGIVGESGSGKSTLARMVVGLLRPSAGQVLVEGVDLFATGDPTSRRDVRRRMQMIFQDPYASLDPRWRVGAIVDEPIFAFGLVEAGSGGGASATSGPHGITERTAELLRLVGLDPADARKYPHEFSGGQRQRIAIARALASNPDFIVCDEPTSALDVSIQAQILNLLRDLQEKLGLAYLLITHNLAVVRFMATRIGVMYLGRFVEIARTDDLFARPRHPYTRVLLDAVPDLTMSGRPRTPVGGEPPNPIDPPPGCPFHPRCAFAIERCRNEVPPFRDNVACHLAHDDPDWLARA
jgi:peptide/nickel transport system ATP-binding protein